MVEVVLAAKEELPELAKKLREKMLRVFIEGQPLEVEMLPAYNPPHLVCRLGKRGFAPQEKDRYLFCQAMAETLAAFVVEKLTVPYISDLLSQHYFYFPKSEREEILEFALQEIRRNADNCATEELQCEMKNDIAVYLENNSYLNVNGFIRFRMGRWLESLRTCLDKAVDHYLMEKEYREFVKLLQYFVQLQEPKVYQLNVTLDEENNVAMFDQNGENMQADCDSEWDCLGGDLEDRLISMLITAAPQWIVLHRPVVLRFPKATETLQAVFDKRVTICKGCKSCQVTNREVLKGKP